MPTNIVDVSVPPNEIIPNSPAAAAQNSKNAKNRQLLLPPNEAQRWLFGGGEYFFDETLDITRPIWLEGVGGSFEHPGTVFRFPEGKHGLFFHFQSYTDNAQGAAALNICLRADGKGEVAHGIVVRAGACFLFHVLVENFRGNGIDVIGKLTPENPRIPPTNADLFRFESVSAVNNGDSKPIASLTRLDRVVTITAAGHKLKVGDRIWLEPDPMPGDDAPIDPNFPRGLCDVEEIEVGGDPDTFLCRHEQELAGSATTTKTYKLVVGHGIYTHDSDANAGNCFACNFTGNAGWGVFEDSFLGNSYWGCHTEANGVGPYRAVRSSALGAGFYGCYAEGGKASEIGRPAVVVGGDHSAAGIVGNASVLREGFLDATSARIKNNAGAKSADIGSVGLGAVTEDVPHHLLFLHREDDRGLADFEGYRFAYTFDDASFGQKIASQLPTYDWKKIYFMGWKADSAAFFLTTRGTLSRSGRPISAGKIVFPSGWFTPNGRRHVDRDSVPALGNVASDEMTWEVGDRIYKTNPVPNESEGWVCVESGTLDTYDEGLTATIEEKLPFLTEHITLSGLSRKLRPGMWLDINGVTARIVALSGTRLRMTEHIPGGEKIPISFHLPVFRKFGWVWEDDRRPCGYECPK